MLPIPPAKDASESAGLPVLVHCWDLRRRYLLGLGSGCRVSAGGRRVLAMFGSAFFWGARSALIDVRSITSCLENSPLPKVANYVKKILGG
jgi:hypothetical protein